MQQRTLQRLTCDERLVVWRRLLPRVLAQGTAGGGCTPSRARSPGRSAPRSPTSRPRRTPASATSGCHLRPPPGHRPRRGGGPGTHHRMAGAGTLAGRPGAAPVRRCAQEQRRPPAPGPAAGGGGGWSVWVSSTYGLLPRQHFDGPSHTVEGIIDWAQARKDDPAVIDPITLLLAERAGRQRIGIGEVVRELLRGRTAVPVGAPSSRPTVPPARPIPCRWTSWHCWPGCGTWRTTCGSRSGTPRTRCGSTGC